MNSEKNLSVLYKPALQFFSALKSNLTQGDARAFPICPNVNPQTNKFFQRRLLEALLLEHGQVFGIYYQRWCCPSIPISQFIYEFVLVALLRPYEKTPDEKTLFDCTVPQPLDAWRLGSDQDIGGEYMALFSKSISFNRVLDRAIEYYIREQM